MFILTKESTELVDLLQGNLETFENSDITVVASAVLRNPFIKKIHLPNCTKICENAFEYSISLETLILESVETIENEIYQQCPSVSYIYIGDKIQSIDKEAFATGCDAEVPVTITIDKPQDAIEGSPWGAKDATVIWKG